MGAKLGILVVDDSAICRELIVAALAEDPEVEIIGQATNGREAIDMTRALKPSVITMDVDMPVMDGLTAIEHIMADTPTPILVLTADPRKQAPELTCRALELGALGLLVKPAMDSAPESKTLLHEVKLLATVKVIKHLRGIRKKPSGPELPRPAEALRSGVGLVVVGSSTGGPIVLHKFFSALPADFPAPVLVVQHIDDAFSESMTGWLAASSKLRVSLAKDGDMLVPGQVFVGGARKHLVVAARGRVGLKAGAPSEPHVPSVNALFESAAQVYGRRVLAVLLSGMGVDGADGMVSVKKAGGSTVAQSKESCVVFGMPGEAASRGVVDRFVHSDDLAATITSLVQSPGNPGVA